MAYDEGLAQRIRDLLSVRTPPVEKKMFGGIAFMVRGHMCCGVIGNVLMVRVGPARHDEALKRPHARPMDFTGRPMNGYLYVDPDGLESDAELAAWLHMCEAFVRTLPPK